MSPPKKRSHRSQLIVPLAEPSDGFVVGGQWRPFGADEGRPTMVVTQIDHEKGIVTLAPIEEGE